MIRRTSIEDLARYEDRLIVDIKGERYSYFAGKKANDKWKTWLGIYNKRHRIDLSEDLSTDALCFVAAKLILRR